MRRIITNLLQSQILTHQIPVWEIAPLPNPVMIGVKQIRENVEVLTKIHLVLQKTMLQEHLHAKLKKPLVKPVVELASVGLMELVVANVRVVLSVVRLQVVVVAVINGGIKTLVLAEKMDLILRPVHILKMAVALVIIGILAVVHVGKAIPLLRHQLIVTVVTKKPPVNPAAGPVTGVETLANVKVTVLPAIMFHLPVMVLARQANTGTAQRVSPTRLPNSQ